LKSCKRRVFEGQKINGDWRSALSVPNLAPVTCLRPDQQRREIGSALVKTSLENGASQRNMPRHAGFLVVRAIGCRRRVAGVAAAVGLAAALAGCGGSPPISPRTSSRSESTTAALTKAVKAMQQGNNALAVVDFLAVVRTDRSNYIAWYDLGVIATENGQATQAANDYLSSLSGNPKYVPALYNLAILETAKQPQTAAELYQKVINIQQNDADAHLNYGFLLESMGQRLAGQLQIAAAVQLDPSLNPRVPSSALTSS
jgi:Tfp pilus assembly protein PilF